VTSNSRLIAKLRMDKVYSGVAMKVLPTLQACDPKTPRGEGPGALGEKPLVRSYRVKRSAGVPRAFRSLILAAPGSQATALVQPRESHDAEQ
jgi:hypothetical protein